MLVVSLVASEMKGPPFTSMKMKVRNSFGMFPFFLDLSRKFEEEMPPQGKLGGRRSSHVVRFFKLKETNTLPSDAGEGTWFDAPPINMIR